MVALKIRDDLTAGALREWARKQTRGRPAARAYAIANALEGARRAGAARRVGMERQALRDAVLRYNAEGLAGLYDRPKGHRPRRLTGDGTGGAGGSGRQGPDPERDGGSAWTRADLRRWLSARFSKTCHPSSMSRVLRGLGFTRQKIRPHHPRKDPEAEASFKKRGCALT